MLLRTHPLSADAHQVKLASGPRTRAWIDRLRAPPGFAPMAGWA